MKNKKKNSGSVKIDPKVYEQVAKYCQLTGVKVGHFVTKAVEEKLKGIYEPQYP